MKTSFGTWVSQMGLPSFVDIILFSFFIFYYFFRSLKSKSTQIIRPQKGNYKEFRSTISFKFLALGIWNLQSTMHLDCVQGVD